MISITAINKAKADILKSLWMVISKGGFTFKSPNVTIHKIITGKTTSRTVCLYKTDSRVSFGDCTIIKNNKDKICKEIGVGVKDVQEILSELSKTFNIATETTIECTIDSGYLKKSNWKYFKAAEITCYQNTGHKKIEEITYDLKNYSGELDGIFDQYQFRNTYNLSTLKITLPLDIDYISSIIILPFIMGTHERLGTGSFISLLDKDTLSLIVSQC
jgi:hypothetical protein